MKRAQRKEKVVDPEVQAEEEYSKLIRQKVDYQKVFEAYVMTVFGKSTSILSGAHPADIEGLIKQGDRMLQALKNKIIEKEIELFLQMGAVGIEKAHDCLKKFEAEKIFPCPVNQFARDKQQGGAIYIGAHCFFGAIRDAGGELYPIYWTQKDRSKPSDRWLRNDVLVRPHHILLYRDEKMTQLIFDPDEVQGQQPVGDVPGFARYEVLNPPLYFKYDLRVLVAGKFAEFLGDREAMRKTIYASTWHGLGARRSCNSGGWEVLRISEAVMKWWQ